MSRFHDGILPLIASNMAWVENILNLTTSYYKVTSSEGYRFEYLVHFPPGYASTLKAHWTTDVIVLDPSCSWQTGATTGRVDDNNDSYWSMMLPGSNLGFSFPSDKLGMFLLSSNIFMCLPDFSIKLCEYHAGFIFRVLQHECCGIHSQCPCGWFCTFCHRST